MKKVTTLLIAILVIQFSLAQETEPNDDPGSANIALLGDTIKGTISPDDVADFFELEIPEGGLLHLDIKREPEFSAEWWIFILDAESGDYPEITKANLYWLNNINAMSVHVLAGKYFIKVGQAAGEVNYRILPTLTPPVLVEDVENNDVPDSSLVWDGNTLLTGNLRYYNPGTGIDKEDWYRFEVTEPTRLHLDITDNPESWTSWWLYLLDGEQEGFPVISQADLYWNSGINSLTRALLEGTYYIKIGDAGGIVNYRVEPTHTLPEWPGEPEPNNEIVDATELPLNDTITGLIRYYDPGIGRDLEDWYQINIPGSGLLKMDIFNAEENANFWAYLKDGNTEGNPNIQSIQFYWLTGNRHKHVEQRLDSGIYYLQFANADRGLSYQIVSELIRDPVADFEYTQVNNSVLFNNLSQHVSQYSWDFGDEIQSEVVNPLHEYEGPGVYDVCLTVDNDAGSDQACNEVIVEGLASVYPKEAGNIGDATLTIVGGGLEQFSKIILEKNGVPIISRDSAILDERDELSGRLDLREAALGTYDVVIETSSGSTYMLEEAFTIVEGTSPDPWIEISGRDRILFNTPSTYTVRYGNNGNVDATFVPIWLAFSEVNGLEIEFIESAMINIDEDSVSIESDEELFYFISDSLFGEPFKCRVFPLIKPVIPANYSGEFKIKINTNDNIRIVSWVNEPMLESPIKPNPKRCVAQVLNRNYQNSFSPELNPDEINCITDQYEKIITNFGNEYGKTHIEVFIAFFTRYSISKVALGTHISLIRNTLVSCVPNRLKKGDLSEAITRVLINQVYTNPNDLKACSASACKKEKPPTVREDDDCTDCGTYCALNICEKNIIAVSSFDPNEKDQLAGYTEENFTFLRKTIPYTIYFENLDSATAPAHVVRVVDSLDASKFDFSTLQFGSVTIGDSTYYAEKGFNELIMDVPLNHLNLVARVEGRFDTLTGLLEWTFYSLDPVTLKPIEDPDVGFLPPNVTKPEGEGHVTFQIDLIPELENMDVVQNKALIYFDANDPIETNISSFALDLDAPDSNVEDLEMETSDTLILVEWGGRDLESGVRSYDVYYSKDDGELTRWKRRTSLTSDHFDAEPGGVYRFFSVAIDSVGNEEAFPEDWDAETFITTSTNDQEIYDYGIMLFPNPCYDMLKVEMELDEGGSIEWSVNNALGTKVIHSPLRQISTGYYSFEVNMSNLPGGVYFLNMLVNDRFASKKFVLINN